tara:strand:+ start:8857 stop:9120 length:264 start_codon:yes stop_codon:yes gene_type:complete
MSNFELISKTVLEWNKKKPLPILDKMSRALSEMYLHTIGLENQEWYWNKTIEEYRTDKLRAIKRARKAETKIAELEKQIENYKRILG